MIGETVLGVAAGIASLSGIALSAAGKTKKTMWVLWINRHGNMVGRPVQGLDNASSLQEKLKAWGRSSVVVVKKPDGTFELTNHVYAAAPVNPTEALRA